MVENGEVSVEDAIGMMSPPDQGIPSAEPAGTGRALRVRVTDRVSGTKKVSVRIPVGIMKWGLAVGSRFAPGLDDLDWDEMMTDLDQYADGRLVEVENAVGSERVEIYIE
jgi:hypothetical protein